MRKLKRACAAILAASVMTASMSNMSDVIVSAIDIPVIHHFDTRDINPVIPDIPGAVITADGCLKSIADMYEVLEIPEGITEIGPHAFDGNQNLQRVQIPSTCKKICAYAFQNCANLREVEILDGCHEILTGAFFDCYVLKKVTMTNSVRRPNIIFDHNYCLSELTVSCMAAQPMEDETDICTLFGMSRLIGRDHYSDLTITLSDSPIVWEKGERVNTKFVDGKLKVIRDTLKAIDYQKLIIPEGYVEIQTGAISSNRVQTIEMTNSVREIDDGAISNCTNLQNLTASVFIGSRAVTFTSTQAQEYNIDITFSDTPIMPTADEMKAGITDFTPVISRNTLPNYKPELGTITVPESVSIQEGAFYNVAFNKLNCYASSLVGSPFIDVNVSKDADINIIDCVVKGDCNNDGSVTVADLIELKSVLLAEICDYGDNTHYDVNNDGSVTIMDLAALKRMLI